MTIFIISILITTILISILLSLLGSVVLWQNYTYFSDGLIHSCMLAGSIIAIYQVPVFLAAILVSIAYTLLVFILQTQHDKSIIIAIVSSGMLSLAIILPSLYSGIDNIDKLLFGDILSVNWHDLIYLSLLIIVTLIFLYYNYHKLIILSLNKELAFAIGFKPLLIEWSFLVILSTVIIISIKIFGGILLTALLIIPAATARILSYSAMSMMVLAVILSSIFNLTGVIFSFYTDISTTAAMILVNVIAFILIHLSKNCYKYWISFKASS